MAKDLAQVVNKYKTNAGAAQGAYTDGINNTTVDPTALAIANQAGMLAGVTQAVTSGFWANRLRAVGKAGWQAAAIAKAGNYGTGITAGAPKYEAAMTQWLPVIQSTAAAAKAMPGQTVDQRLARATYLGKTLYNRKRGL
jgi:hypothetical protein